MQRLTLFILFILLSCSKDSPIPDTTPPTITLSGSSTINLTVGDTFADPGAIAEDSIDGGITSSITSSGTVDTSTEGTYTIEYSVTDAAGNSVSTIRTVIVNPLPDTTPPTITLTGSSTINLTVGDTFADPGATAEDSIDGDITSSITTSGTVDTSIAGTYSVEYSVLDSGNNTSSVTRTIIVNTPPDTTTSYSTRLTTFANDESGFGIFTKKVLVFGIPMYTTDEVPNAKLEHAAHVMAQYLDNDEDGTPDNSLVVDKMIENHSFLLVWNNESDLNIFETLQYGEFGQDLGAVETAPNWHTNGRQGPFDATLEEVLHMITQRGYAEVYPQIFGETTGTSVADAMDVARGGQFDSNPSEYPAQAWYTYDDDSCDYSCQVTEYMYWSLTSILGAHTARATDISEEWALNTLSLVQQTDPTIYELLTDSSYTFPTVLPDGNYLQ